MKLQWNDTIVTRVRESERFRTPSNVLLQCLIFLGIFLLGSICQSLVMMPKLMGDTMDYAYEQLELTGQVTDGELNEYMTSLLSTAPYVVLTLYATVAATLITLLFCRLIEKRKLSTLGFTAKGAPVQYLLGLGVGFVLFSAVVGLSFAMGGIRAEGVEGASASGLVLIGFGWLLQGMSEEVIFRGYFMTTLLRRHSPWVAVAVNSIGFALAHGANNGVSIMALLNLTLFGVTISLYVLRTGNLWGACAIHSIWNFTQGNFYGLPVSGMDTGGSVFRFSLKEGMDLVNGGAFGAEAGIPTTIVLLAAIAVLLFVPFGRTRAQEQAVSV